MAALLGLRGSLLGPGAVLISGTAVLIVAVFADTREIEAARKLEVTTSLALALIFILGILVGESNLFTPAGCSILASHSIC